MLQQLLQLHFGQQVFQARETSLPDMRGRGDHPRFLQQADSRTPDNHLRGREFSWPRPRRTFPSQFLKAEKKESTGPQASDPGESKLDTGVTSVYYVL